MNFADVQKCGGQWNKTKEKRQREKRMKRSLI